MTDISLSSKIATPLGQPVTPLRKSVAASDGYVKIQNLITRSIRELETSFKNTYGKKVGEAGYDVSFDIKLNGKVGAGDAAANRKLVTQLQQASRNISRNLPDAITAPGLYYGGPHGSLATALKEITSALQTSLSIDGGKKVGSVDEQLKVIGAAATRFGSVYNETTGITPKLPEGAKEAHLDINTTPIIVISKPELPIQSPVNILI